MKTELDKIFDRIEIGVKGLQLLNLYKANHTGSTNATVRRNLQAIEKRLPDLQLKVLQLIERTVMDAEGRDKAAHGAAIGAAPEVAKPKVSLVQRLAQKMKF